MQDNNEDIKVLNNQQNYGYNQQKKNDKKEKTELPISSFVIDKVKGKYFFLIFIIFR